MQTQTFAPAEIVVVDDGSTDGGIEWLESLALPNLILSRRGVPGPGGYAARNRGIELAKSEWIAFLDADDEWLPTHLESVYGALRMVENPSRVVAVFSGYENLYEGGQRTIDPYSAKIGGPVAELDFATLLGQWLRLNASPLWTSATVCRRNALIDAGQFPEGRCRRGGDKDMWLRIAHTGTVVYTGSVTARYFRDSVNMTTKASYANTVPCIVDSAKRLAALDDGAISGQLQALQNLEILNYALVSARTTGLEKASWADFNARLDPIGGLLLRFLSTPLGARIARLAFSLKRLVPR